MSGRHKALKWTAVDPAFSVEELVAGTGDFRVTPRDTEMLGLLFDRHFLQARHLTKWAGISTLDKFDRLIRILFQHGLVARARARPAFRDTAEYVYGLWRVRTWT